MSLRARTGRAALLRRTTRWGARGIGVGLLALGLVVGYFWLSTELPAPEHLRARAALGSTRILDRRGQLLYELPDPFSGRQRPVPLSEIPPALRQATIAIEDASFYGNPGVDLRGIARALWLDLRSGSLVAGGSTITQQLARGFLLDPQLAQQRSLERKLREAVLALKLTANYSKDEILALYLNQTYYGGMVYGVEAAAQHYFNKPARDLDLAECALLAGLPQAPSHYNPLENPQAALARQALVLDAMVRAGQLTPEQAAAAKAEQLFFAGEGGRMRAPHFVQYVLGLLDAQLGPDTVARGGLTITTTLDADLQDAAQEILRRQIAQLSTPRSGGPDHRVRNGAVVVLDPASGAILTMVGSPDFADARSQGQVNGALARRQPGSAIKPLTYAAALERGWTPATTILDVPSSFPTREGHPYKPQNYDRAYHGPLSLREALATSSNVAAVRVLSEIGLPALLEMADRLGVSSLGEAGAGRYGLSLTLGGGEVTPLELSAAFAAFANGGYRVTPYAIVEIRDWRLEIVDHPNLQSPISQFSLSLTAGRLFNQRYSLRPLRPHARFWCSERAGPRPAGGGQDRDDQRLARQLDRRLHAGPGGGRAGRQRRRAADGGDQRDHRCRAGVALGDAGGAPRPAAAPVQPPGRHRRAAGLRRGRAAALGGLPDRAERALRRRHPADPPGRHAHGRGGGPGAGLPRAGRLPGRSGGPAHLPHCAAGGRVVGGFGRAAAGAARAVPTDRRRPLRHGSGRRPPTADHGPPTAADTPGVADVPLFGASGPALLTPASGAAFTISPGIPRDRQQIELKARAGAEVAELTIVIDGRPLATFAGPPYRAFWQLTPGRHRALVETRDAQGRVRRSEEIAFVVTE